MNGRLFQVTPTGEIVWEYINPYFADSALGEWRVVHTNRVYRAQPVPYDWVPEATPHSEKAVAEIYPARLSSMYRCLHSGSVAPKGATGARRLFLQLVIPAKRGGFINR
jgi:hypothetical protein